MTFFPDKSYISVGFEPEEMMRLFEIQRTMHTDSKRAIHKTIEIMYNILTSPKLAQIKLATGNPLLTNDLVLRGLIDQAYQYHLEEGNIKT